MPDTIFRTEDQLNQAKWAEKFLNVASGKQYTSENSPFPLHEYFRNKLLGSQIKMLEVNAGATVVDTFVADTMTDMTIVVGDGKESDKKIVQQITEWMNGIDYPIKLEEAMKNYYGAGFGLQQPIFRDDQVFISNVDPSRYYPTMQVFDWQSVNQAKIITPFYELTDRKQKQWYAFVEEHTVGRIEYKLFKLKDRDALEGSPVGLESTERTKGLKPVAKTELETFDIIQVDRTKSSETLMGQSILCNVWDLLQEVTETQTQLRHERIKHLKAKMYGSGRTFQPADTIGKPTTWAAKVGETAEPNGKVYDMNQEILIIPEGSNPPGYVQRDLESLTKGIAHIEDCLSKIAFTVGAPESIFNLDQRGDIKVDTEKRKDRKYVRQILQAQKRASSLAVQMIETWWRWTNPGAEVPVINVAFANPFDLSAEEITDLMRKQNPDALFVSGKEARKQIWPNKTPDELEQMEKDIEDEAPNEPTISQLSKPPVVELP